ncbi:type II toxin-antitoxin system HipA family toxin [Roseibacillus persicicus]|uniref:type II toxin-antitoxin system HipA family toxin n=1 Tax=Roseibacillus persicicus TaxID=454148 RepID=UPI00398B0444
MTDQLYILIDGEEIGDLYYDRQADQISFSYRSSWAGSHSAYPISVSLPLGASTHSDRTLRHFLSGLLTDNSNVLRAWGKQFHVSPYNQFDLLKNIGEDCAGAIQFVQPDRLEKIKSGELDKLTPLSDEEVVQRIHDLKKQSHAIPLHIDGRFSLAGAQTKDALQWKDNQWFFPEGRQPTTHILKPQLEDFEGHSINEHFCLALAKETGIPAASSEVTSFQNEVVIVVKRYDRSLDSEGIYTRIHQEDFCQAMALHPRDKYQADGGPSALQIISLLRQQSTSSETDIDNFLRALTLNWAIAGTDAHAKNYSILHAPRGVLRLAPLYDLASFLPYRPPKSRKTKMAMKYGHTYHLHKIDLHQWETLAKESKLKPKRVLPLVSEYLEKLREESLPATHALIAEKHACDFLDILVEKITAHTNECLDSLAV